MAKQIAVKQAKKRRSAEQVEFVEPQTHDETALDRSAEAQLDEIDELLEENTLYLGEAALSFTAEAEWQDWLVWRAAYLAKVGLAA